MNTTGLKKVCELDKTQGSGNEILKAVFEESPFSGK